MKSKILISLMAITMLGGSLVGCGEEDNNTVAVSPEEKANLFDENGKYKEQITITGIGTYSESKEDMSSGVSIEKFPYLDALKETLNINFERLWLAPPEQFEQKFGIAMASGELPDIMQISRVDYEVLKENGQLADLSWTLDYANDYLKDYLNADPTLLETLKDDDGKLYTIPQYFDTRRELNMMYYRKDWLDELGLKVPKTVEEFESIMKAFKEKKGAKQGFAVGGNKVSDWGNDVRSYLGIFGSYPSAWIEKDGKLVAGEVQPETKVGLEYLAKWYKEGYINKEFVSMDIPKSQQSIINGETGIIIGPWWMYESCMNLLMQKDPAAEWVTAPIPSYKDKGKPIMPRTTISKYFVVNSKSKHPEALVKLMNFSIESNINSAPYVKKDYVWNWDPAFYTDPFDVQHTYDKFNEALEKDPTATAPALETFTEQEKVWWDIMPDFLEYQNGNLEAAKKKEGHFGVINARIYNQGGWKTTMEIAKSGKVVYNEFYGAPTETMKQKSATLNKLIDENFLKIIMGELPIDVFDKFVDDWHKLGGEQITEEVNEWYENNK